MRIAITGAAGQLGRLTAQRVLERVPAGELVLVTRRPQAVADLAEAGAIVRHGEHGATEAAIRDRGLRCTALRNGLYAEFQVAAAARAAASGRLVHNNGDGATDGVSPAVEDLTGRPPRTLHEVLEAHRSELEETA